VSNILREKTMAIVYQCTDEDCGTTHAVMPQDGKCPDCKARLKAVETGEKRGRERKVFPEKHQTERLEGLCVLVCDVSNSMNEIAFPVEQPDQTKLELVAEAVQSAVDAMHDLSMIDNAYIAIIAFGYGTSLIRDRQGKPFIKSVKSILKEFGEEAAIEKARAEGARWELMNEAEKKQKIKQESLASYLKNQFKLDVEKVDRSATNITGALDLAYKVTDGAIKGNLSQWQFTGRVSLIPHMITPDIEDPQSKFELPNVRVMIYSDGAHNMGEDVVRNPFVNMKPISVLLTAFIGDPENDEDAKKGADTMEKIATICPIHNGTSYFLINRATHGELLRQLFRMATTYSGFCTECAREERKSQNPKRELRKERTL
jgi:hypothetical protein